jgi:RNA polymerase sigma-70 factor (ECF subfamily)
VSHIGEASGEATSPSASDLVERYTDVVYNLAARLTGDHEEGRDLAQDAFIRILRGASTFRGEASVKTWICQVVINTHRNRRRWWRRLKRGRTVSLDAPLSSGQEGGPSTLGETLADPAPSPERQIRGRETARRLQRELMRLPSEMRAALLLREVEGMSYGEIAAALGVREGTVKSRLARAREALRLSMAGVEPGGVRQGGGS